MDVKMNGWIDGQIDRYGQIHKIPPPPRPINKVGLTNDFLREFLERNTVGDISKQISIPEF